LKQIIKAILQSIHYKKDKIKKKFYGLKKIKGLKEKKRSNVQSNNAFSLSV
jgi:hypothetical protein